jgi:hypothetical protein
LGYSTANSTVFTFAKTAEDYVETGSVVLLPLKIAISTRIQPAISSRGATLCMNTDRDPRMNSPEEDRQHNADQPKDEQWKPY